MARFCSVCGHRERVAIDKAIIGGEAAYRRIAAQYGLTEQSVRRHATDHLLPQLVRDWQAERADTGRELAEELQSWMDRLRLMSDAVHEFLTDPDDPTKYTLAPHTWEITIHTETIDNSGRKPVVIRRKMRLSEAIDHVDGKAGIGDVVLVESKTSDPRDLLLKTSARLESHLRLLGELVGKLQTQGTVNFIASPEWVALRGRMLASLALYPDARLALAAALDGDTATEAEWEVATA